MTRPREAAPLTPIQAQLMACRDPAYRAFHCKLIPTVDPETVLGVRTPQIRALAKGLAGTPAGEEFLQTLPHRYYEENNLHGALIAQSKSYPWVVEQLDCFRPYVDNWATCDLISPKIFRKHLPELEGEIPRWLADPHLYTARFGMGMLLSFYLDEAFRPAHLDWVAGVRQEEYYGKMMAAWYFATALAKQYAAALPYLQEHRLDPWTHNKAIQKALESARVSPEHKAFLRTLRLPRSAR